jgi:hypothetical protein
LDGLLNLKLPASSGTALLKITLLENEEHLNVSYFVPDELLTETTHWGGAVPWLNMPATK